MLRAGYEANLVENLLAWLISSLPFEKKKLVLRRF
jgi:hypothetical protein